MIFFKTVEKNLGIIILFFVLHNRVIIKQLELHGIYMKKLYNQKVDF